MIQDGYKETKIGTIPEVWEVRQLGSFGDFFKGKTITKSEITESGFPCIRYGDIYVQYEFANIVTHFSAYISKETAKNGRRLLKGDIIFAGTGETQEDIGKCVAYTRDDEAYAGGDLVVFRPKKDIGVDSEFLSSCLNTGEVAKRKSRLGQGLSVFHIYSSHLQTLEVPLPPLLEQKKITVILSTVDDAIEKTDTMIEETKQLKKGLMQKFFVNKAYMILRKANEEPTELKPIYLRELGKILTGTTPSTKVDEYYCSQDYMFIGPADLGNDKSPDTSEKYISSAGFKVARQLPSDSVMVVCIGATIGKVGITNKPCATNQQINTIIPSKAYSADYVYYLISGISKYLLAFAGDTATPILNKGEFGKVVTFVHNSLDERHQIAKILSAVDTKIENEMSTREQLEQLKKGLMQLLLTGKIRVKV